MMIKVPNILLIHFYKMKKLLNIEKLHYITNIITISFFNYQEIVIHIYIM